MRTAGSRSLLASLVVLGGLALTACGDDKKDDDAGTKPDLPSCLANLTPADLPSDGSFPADWPFPPDTVVTLVEPVPGQSGAAVTAQVGAEFEEVLPFMQHDLEDAGFVATRGEAEEDDAEAVWSGNGYTGTWAIRASSTCDGTTLLQVAAAKQ